MILYARFVTVDHGTYSEYVPNMDGTYGYGVYTWDDEWLVFDNEDDAILYHDALITEKDL